MSQTETSRFPRRLWALAPFLAFAAVGAVFAVQLYHGHTNNLPSALIDRPAPEFSLANLQDGGAPFTDGDLRAGEVTVVNLFASWCGPCKLEHPELVKLAALGDVRLYGVAYRDEPSAASRMLGELGNPFAKVGLDQDGQASLRWGVSGVPETFVVAGDGTVVYKHVGPIQNSDLDKKILPAIEAARKATRGG